MHHSVGQTKDRPVQLSSWLSQSSLSWSFGVGLPIRDGIVSKEKRRNVAVHGMWETEQGDLVFSYEGSVTCGEGLSLACFFFVAVGDGNLGTVACAGDT
jgi:hypothetical protein